MVPGQDFTRTWDILRCNSSNSNRIADVVRVGDKVEIQVIQSCLVASQCPVFHITDGSMYAQDQITLWKFW